MRLQPGTAVTPNVRLERPIAQGAMGSVWLAEHLTLNTSVAVKFISDRLDPDAPEVLERFIREASVAAQIKSSHVVQTFDQGVMRDGTPYIVMEYLEGEELRERLDREGPMDLETLARIVSQTAKALGMAHKAGIIHRDIKPANVFLSQRDDELHVKVFDFGIAKRRSQGMGGDGDEARRQARMTDPRLGLTNDGVMIGTPEYMSPEQVMSASRVDHRADLWGLAVVAYVAMTGKLPFAGDDVGTLCVSMLERNYPAPSTLRPEVGPEVDRWFARAFAMSIEDRFQTARQLSTEFAEALGILSDPSASELGPVARGRLSSPASGSTARPSWSSPEAATDETGLAASLETRAGAERDPAPARRGPWPRLVLTAVFGLFLGAAAFFAVAGVGPRADQNGPRPSKGSAAPAAATRDGDEDPHEAAPTPAPPLGPGRRPIPSPAGAPDRVVGTASAATAVLPPAARPGFTPPASPPVRGAPSRPPRPFPRPKSQRREPGF